MYGRRMGRSVVRVISGRVAECVSQCQPGGSVDRVVTRYGDIQRIHLVFRAPARSRPSPRDRIHRSRFSLDRGIGSSRIIREKEEDEVVRGERKIRECNWR